MHFVSSSGDHLQIAIKTWFLTILSIFLLQLYFLYFWIKISLNSTLSFFFYYYANPHHFFFTKFPQPDISNNMHKKFCPKTELTCKVPNTTIDDFANTVDSDEMAHNEQCHLDLQCLPSSL